MKRNILIILILFIVLLSIPTAAAEYDEEEVDGILIAIVKEKKPTINEVGHWDTTTDHSGTVGFSGYYEIPPEMQSIEYWNINERFNYVLCKDPETGIDTYDDELYCSIMFYAPLPNRMYIKVNIGGYNIPTSEKQPIAEHLFNRLVEQSIASGAIGGETIDSEEMIDAGETVDIEDEDEPKYYKTIKLDQRIFRVNFNGSGTLTVSGQFVKVVSSKIKEGQSGVTVKFNGHKYFDDQTTKTDNDGKFSFTLDIPEVKDRGKLSGKKISIGVDVDEMQDGEYTNYPGYIDLYHTSTVPKIINFNKRYSGFANVNSWNTFSFDVYDPEDDVEEIIITSQFGEIRWKNKLANLGQLVTDGSEDNMKNYAVVKGPYENKVVEFGWYVPNMGHKFTGFWGNLLQKQKEIHFGSGSITAGATVKGNEELYSYGSGMLDDKSKLKLNENGFILKDEGADNVAKKVKALKYASQLYSAYKLYGDSQNFYKSTRKIMQQYSRTESFGEGTVHGVRFSLEFVKIMDGMVNTVVGKSWFADKGGAELSQLKTFILNVGIDTARGGLDAMADTWDDSKTEKRYVRIPVYVKAIDSQGHSSQVFEYTVLVEYDHIPGTPEKI